MGIGIGPIEIVIVGAVVAGILSFLFSRRSPTLKNVTLRNCPACSAKLDLNVDQCASCGLRIN